VLKTERFLDDILAKNTATIKQEKNGKKLKKKTSGPVYIV
jgi:hypothetical protein